MSKKKLLCVLLSICLLLSGPLTTFALAKGDEGLKNVTLSLYSNLSAETHISGLYSDNIFYITLKDLCSLTGGQVESETEKKAVVTLGKGTREFAIDVGSGNMAEILYSDKCNITMPSLAQNGKVYVSALHFLRYIGATAQIKENSPVQFMVIKRYDIFDALADLVASNCGNFFWWDEVDTGNESLKDKLMNAGLVALVSRDSNIFRMMFDAKGIEQEAIEDALLSIVKNEGQGYFTENSHISELIDTESGIIGAEVDWFDLLTEAFGDSTDKLIKQISDLESKIAFRADLANKIIQAFEGLKQFDNISTVQKNLLAKTILEHPKDSQTLCDGWEVVFDAAQNINAKIQSEYSAKCEEGIKITESMAYDYLNGIGDLAGVNPVSIAWSGANLLTKMIPFTNEMIGKKEQLYNGYNCSVIQLIANEMMGKIYSDWYYSNGPYALPTEQYEKLDDIKQLMILQLKSTLTTRECLIRSGFVEAEYAAEMENMNQKTAILLNQVENCKIVGANLFRAEYTDDLSWMEGVKTESLTSNEATAIWKDFLLFERYSGYTKDWAEASLEYTISDLNADTIPELLMQSLMDTPFTNTWVFVLKSKDIFLANETYGYGSFRYSPNNNLVIGTPMLKPSVETAEYSPFYRLSGTQFEYVFGVGKDEGKILYKDAQGQREISENEGASYFADAIDFEWSPVIDIR